MKGQKIGYIRVSSILQNTDRQLDGLDLDRTFVDKITGKSRDRPQFESMMTYVREGDKVYVHSMDRLARNLVDLRNIVRELTQKGVAIEFVSEKLVFTGEDSPMALLFLSMMGAFAEFELAVIRERQKEGIKLAKERGVYAGRKKIINESQAHELYCLYMQRISISDISKKFNISRRSVYNYLRQERKGVHTA